MLPALLLASAVALAADAPVATTLGQVGVGYDRFKDTVITAPVSMMAIITQKLATVCPGTTTGVLVMPPIVNGQMAAMASVSYQACVTKDAAFELAALPAGTVLTLTGRVTPKRTMGVLTAIAFTDATLVASN